ncbi:uncharacterized protein LOC105209981 [Zeugodacus cucurbitae]|uniref:uncharacterized protein LOC105209981 n=1 Tax=Zeugodacus cucurbitae TaxID=28588 RepID=UPI0023D90722|nr:uncharacterized protein LOC105209981 [Zeugodacus cucurbitae]
MCEAVLERARQQKEGAKRLYQLFKFENMTVTSPPALKVYFWEYFDIDKLNLEIHKDKSKFQHDIAMPMRQINTRPLKIILWLRNLSEKNLDIRLKRIQKCDCVPLETRVGFNQFRQLFHCPHRRLIHILQEAIHMKPQDLVALRIVFYYFLFGEHTLTYEFNFSDSRVITLNFKVNVIGFDPNACIITKELIPTDLREHRRFVQPIWVQNITSQHLNFVFSTRERGLKLMNPNLTVPRLSVWPLMVEYRPSDFENQLDFSLNFENIRSKFHVKAVGYLDKFAEDTEVPVEDYECADFPYVIYPNKIEFDIQRSEQRSLMVAIHNYNQKCVEFRWQNYIISDLFEVTFEPNVFRLKAHHSKLCIVNMRVFERALHFKRIPLALEVHRVFDKSTKIAKELLEEVESIDDPKWKEPSYMVHIFLHLNLKVNFKPEEPINISWELLAPKRERSKVSTTTIFEKLYWDYLSESNFMRPKNSAEINDELSYSEVLRLNAGPLPLIKTLDINRNSILRIISQLIAESLHDLAKNWRFIPIEFAEDPQ